MNKTTTKYSKLIRFFYSFIVLIISSLLISFLYGNALFFFDENSSLPIIPFNPFFFVITFGSSLVSLLIATFLEPERTLVAKRRKMRRFKLSLLVQLIASIFISIFYGMIANQFQPDETTAYLHLNMFQFLLLLSTGITTLLLTYIIQSD